MPNYNGAGKYDPECQRVFEETNAACVALIVFNGDRGGGFSVTGDQLSIAHLPEMLEFMAAQIRAQRGDA